MLNEKHTEHYHISHSHLSCVLYGAWRGGRRTRLIFIRPFLTSIIDLQHGETTALRQTRQHYTAIL